MKMEPTSVIWPSLLDTSGQTAFLPCTHAHHSAVPITLERPPPTVWYTLLRGRRSLFFFMNSLIN